MLDRHVLAFEVAGFSKAAVRVTDPSSSRHAQEIRHRDPVEQRTIALQELMHAALVFRPQVDAEVGTELARVDDDLIPTGYRSAL
jgi:hypothetical protein